MGKLTLSLKSLKFKASSQPSSTFVGVRLAMVLIAMLAVLEMAASAANRFVFRSNDPVIYPTTSPFISMNVGFERIGPKPLPPAIDRLMEAAARLSHRTNVPYVFGGRNISSGKSCSQCADCIKKNNLAANSTLSRLNKCAACRRCGIDCSGFANRVFSEAGIKYGFADTSSLNVARDGFLQKQYGFNNVGRDLMLAQRGDLLLGKGHIVLVIDVNKALGTIDFIHASRGSKRTSTGGIEVRRGVAIDQVQRSVIRILRHLDLSSPEDSGDNIGFVDNLWINMKRVIMTGHRI